MVSVEVKERAEPEARGRVEEVKRDVAGRSGRRGTARGDVWGGGGEGEAGERRRMWEEREVKWGGARLLDLVLRRSV